MSKINFDNKSQGASYDAALFNAQDANEIKTVVNANADSLGALQQQVDDLPPSGTSTWGSITGTLSNQTDLENELSTKANASDVSKISTRDILYITPTFPGSSLPSDFTAVGSPTFTVAANKLNFTGVGSNTYGKFIRSNLGVGTESNTVSATVTIGATPSASTYGVAVGLESYNLNGDQASLRGGLVLQTTDGNFGKPFIQGSGTTVYGSIANTDISNGDVLKYSLSNDGWIIRMVVINITKGWTVRKDQFITGNGITPFIANNSAYPAVYHLGGTISSTLNYTIHAPTTIEGIIFGNSKTYGYGADSPYTRFAYLIGNHSNNLISGTSTDTSAELLTRIPEIVAIKPKWVLLVDPAGNDLLFGVSSSVWQPNLVAIRTALVNAGIEVRWTTGEPRNDTNETAQKTFIQSTFVGDIIVDTWTPLLGSGTSLNSAYAFDQRHLNVAGNAKLAEVVNSAIGFAPLSTATNSSIDKTFGTLPSSSSIVWAYDSNHPNKKVSLATNTTLSITGLSDGESGEVVVIQDAGGSRTIALGAGITNAASSNTPIITANYANSYVFKNVSGNIVSYIRNIGTLAAPPAGFDAMTFPTIISGSYTNNSGDWTAAAQAIGKDKRLPSGTSGRIGMRAFTAATSINNFIGISTLTTIGAYTDMNAWFLFNGQGNVVVFGHGSTIQSSATALVNGADYYISIDGTTGVVKLQYTTDGGTTFTDVATIIYTVISDVYAYGFWYYDGTNSPMVIKLPKTQNFV